MLHAFERRFRDHICACATSFENVEHEIIAAFVLRAAFAHWLEQLVDRSGDFKLHMSITNVGTRGILRFEFLHARLVLDEDADILEEHIGRVARLRRTLATCENLLDLLLNFLRAIANEDRVVERFRHLVDAVDASESTDFTDIRARHRKHATAFDMIVVFDVFINFAEYLIEAPRHFAREFKVRHLIFANRNADRAKRKNVRGLTNGVERETKRVGFAETLQFNFGLERWITHDAIERQQHRKQKGEFSDRGNFTL